MRRLQDARSLVTVEDLRAQHDETLEMALELVQAGRLPGLTDPTILQSRRHTGGVVFDLAFETVSANDVWLLPLDLDAAVADDRERLLAAHAYRDASAACQTSLLDEVLHAAAKVLTTGPVSGVKIAHHGIVTSSTWRVTRPVAILFMSAIGNDGLPALIRIEAHHPHDVPADIRRLVARHRAALEEAERRTSEGAVGAIDEIAAALIALNAVPLARIVAELEWKEEIPFSDPGGTYAGAFKWSELAITARIRHAKGWQLEDDILTIPKKIIPATHMIALTNRPLSALVEAHPLPPQVAITNVEATGHNLIITLRPARHLYGKAMVVGRR